MSSPEYFALSPFHSPLVRIPSYEKDQNDDLELSPFKLPLPKSPNYREDQSGELRGRKLTFGSVGSSARTSFSDMQPLDQSDEKPLELARSPLGAKRTVSERDVPKSLPRPLPVFGDDYGTAKDNAPRMPETPSKKVRTILRGFAEKVSEVLKKIAKEEALTFQTASGDAVFFHVSDSIGSGNFSQAHHIVSSEPLFDEYRNDQVLFKCYQERTIAKKGNVVNSYFNCSTDQYRELIIENFPIAKILNIETARADGFFLVEKIPHSFVATWDVNTSLDSLDEDTMNKLKQIKWMFQRAFDLNISVDLSFSNIKVKDDGTIVLIDFREEQEDYFKEVMFELLRSFAQGNKEIYKFLEPIVGEDTTSVVGQAK